MPFDARTHNPVGNFVQLIGPEPARLDQAEQVLRDAVAKSKTTDNAPPIRYHLATDILRDRRKDVARAKAAAREIITQFPTNDGYTQNLMNWLLDSAAE